MQEEYLSVIQGWMEDPASNANPTVCLMAGTIYSNEGNHVEALKACHGPNSSLEMCASMSCSIYGVRNNCISTYDFRIFRLDCAISLKGV
jgi:hypothetical protein